MQIILDTEQRDVYERLMKVKEIEKICQNNSKFWIENIKARAKYINEMKTTKKVKVFFKLDQIVGLSVIFLAYYEKNLEENLDNLQYKENRWHNKTYNKLKELSINIGGIGELDLFQKALYIIFAELSENINFDN